MIYGQSSDRDPIFRSAPLLLEPRPQSSRPGPPRLWKRFDDSIAGVGAALEGESMIRVAGPSRRWPPSRARSCRHSPRPRRHPGRRVALAVVPPPGGHRMRITPSRAYTRYAVGMVGHWVEQLRARHRLSQGQLAYRANTSQQAISRIERGVVSPSIEVLERLAAACGEQLVLDARPREVPIDPSQLEARAEMSPQARAELSFGWNKLGGELTLAGAIARGER